ncbi:MAG: DUF305 domain-containing protein [Candidatus Sericytochromatia bacterium]
MRSTVVRIVAAVAVVLTAGLVSACGGDSRPEADSQQTTKQADHNANDITFAQNMVPHHEQAVVMAQMVPTNTANMQMVRVSELVIARQVAEIQAFRAWLMERADTSSGPAADHDAAGHGATMPGMVDAATMNKLQTLKGADFDRLWLTLMIDHHRGAIEMARDELAHGKNPDVLYLARTIVTEQQAEIDQMKKMLGG